MQYLLMIYGSEAAMTAAPKEAITKMSAPTCAYTEAMKKAGVLVGGERLKPVSTATTVRVVDGKTNVLDGPYADTKEQLGGYYMVDVPDIDRRSPGRRAVRAPRWARWKCVRSGRCRRVGQPSMQAGADRARAAAEAAARQSYGKLVAYPRRAHARRGRRRGCACRRLCRGTGTLAGERRAGQKPEAWLLAVARRRSVDAVAAADERWAAREHLMLIAEEMEAEHGAADLPDERLRLMFACAHPAIEAGIRAPLILQTILGFDAGAIASAFLVSPATMSQAAGAGQKPHPRGGYSLQRARARRARREAGCRAGGDLCSLRRRLVRP